MFVPVITSPTGKFLLLWGDVQVILVTLWAVYYPYIKSR